MPLGAMREQLEYWQSECAAARESGDAGRVAQCEHFIQQCEKVIAALENAAPAPQTPRPPAQRDDFF
jgi:hypothetical protein